MRVFRQDEFIRLEKAGQSISFKTEGGKLSSNNMSALCKTLILCGVELDVANLANNKVLQDLDISLDGYETLQRELDMYRLDLHKLREKLLIDSYEVEMQLKPEEVREALISYLGSRPSRLREIVK